MASPNVKCDIFLADGLLCEGILCPPSMPAGSQFAVVAKVNTLPLSATAQEWPKAQINDQGAS